MLRRKPTALTISPEDLLQFEDIHARKLAYRNYLKTGEDPGGLFLQTVEKGANATNNINMNGSGNGNGNGNGNGSQARHRSSPGKADPSDELKPLPGDKARIVRSREERIVGGAGR